MNISKATLVGRKSLFTSDQDVELRRLIRDRTGIVIQDHQVENFYNTVATAMQHFGHAQCKSFIQSLRVIDKNSPELEFLITGITVGESYFFRDEGQIEFLRNEFLPKLIAKRSKTDKHLRIWSAGCSDGQELYTLAFLLMDLIPDIENWRIHLLGTDINTDTLAKCMRGQYREWSFRNTPDSIRKRYFKKCKEGYILHEEVQQIARFSYLNLAEDAFPSLLTDTNAIDLVLCRNVFIYFDQETVTKVLQKFTQCLVPDGILMLGASDLVNNLVPGLELVHDRDSFYYQRQKTKQKVKTQKTPTVKPLSELATAKPKAVQKTSVTKQPTKPGNLTTDSMQQLRVYLAEEKWQSVDEEVNRCLLEMGESSELLVYKATAAANLGNLDQASSLCEQALKLDSVNKHAHYLSAIVSMELDQSDAAEAALRKVLFLDAQFLEAHYQLGLLQLRNGRQTQGMKSLKNALQIAERGNPQYSLHGAPDTNFKRMVEVLSKEINLHETNTQVVSR